MKTNFLALENIEKRANELIWKYEESYGLISAPVPVEKIAENIIDLIIEWNNISDNSDEIIFAGLDTMNKKVVFNERRRSIYDDTDGLYNTVLAHEVGHWVLHVDGIELGLQKVLPGTEVTTKFVYRSKGPSSPIEWQAHSFMGFLLLPYKLLRSHIDTGDIYEWSGLYYMKEKFDVTISALVMRLKKLGLIYIDDDKTIYHSEGESKGQIRMV